ncbi:MAG: hypothetical protein JJ913_03240 [Rhizobiaceae bacterium]|nr:hypothetical protein [Rhizobiaceae bacterium]
MQETSLYAPVKSFLEKHGFAVKGEIGGCDIVGVAGNDPPVLVICELKLRFNLELVLQAVERAAACDEVWLAARIDGRKRGREADKRFRALCRRLGFGMLGVTEAGRVEVIVSPISPFPRKDNRRRSRLIAEYNRRRGDPATGGSTRRPIMTAYRQEALACAAAMTSEPRRPRDFGPQSSRAASILQRNVYGWFERVGYGLYGLTSAGHAALETWADQIEDRQESDEPVATTPLDQMAPSA